jgi:septin family protein
VAESDPGICHRTLTAIVIVENGVKLKLNIVDTPGYGDLINNEGCWDPIVKYVGIACTSVTLWQRSGEQD